MTFVSVLNYSSHWLIHLLLIILVVFGPQYLQTGCSSAVTQTFLQQSVKLFFCCFCASSCLTFSLRRPPVVSTEKADGWRVVFSRLRCVGGAGGLRCVAGLTAAGSHTWCSSPGAWCRTAGWPGCWSESRSSRRRCSDHSEHPSAAEPDPDLLHSPQSANRKQEVGVQWCQPCSVCCLKTLFEPRPRAKFSPDDQSEKPAEPTGWIHHHRQWSVLWLDDELWCHGLYLCKSRQLAGDHGLELGGVHGRSIICSFVKLCDQRVDGQLQIWVLRAAEHRESLWSLINDKQSVSELFLLQLLRLHRRHSGHFYETSRDLKPDEERKPITVRIQRTSRFWCLCISVDWICINNNGGRSKSTNTSV